MSFAFFNRDYILNRGEQDFTAEHLSAVLSACRRYCSWFSFTGADAQTLPCGELDAFLTEPPLPDSTEKKLCYSVCDESIRILEKRFSGFFDFRYIDGNTAAEDPAFYRADGSIFLESCDHEGEVFLYPRDREDISDVLSFGGWIEMVGGSPCALGTPRALAADHQMPPDPDWNVKNDALYRLLCDVFRQPEKHLEEAVFSQLYAYLSGFQRGWSTPMPGKKTARIPSWPYTPMWFFGCELYILARYGQTTDVSLPTAYRRAGISDKAAFHQFFCDMRQYLCPILSDSIDFPAT